MPNHQQKRRVPRHPSEQTGDNQESPKMSSILDQDEDALKKTLVKDKRNFTRYVNAAGRQTEFASKHPSTAAATEVTTAHERVKKAYYSIITTLDALQEVSEQDEDCQLYENNKEDVQNRYEAIVERILSTVEEIAKPTQAANAQPIPAGGGARAQTKIMEALKPEKLTQEHNPVEFRSWRTQWRSFYNASRIDLLDLEDQQTYFKVSIDPNLYESVLQEIDRNTPIFGNGGCMELITAVFESLYPLASRRVAYFKLRQDPDLPFSTYSNKLKQIGNEADLNTIRKEELHVFRYITGCTDKKLRAKFLEQDNPDLAELDRIVRAYERSHTTTKTLETREPPCLLYTSPSPRDKRQSRMPSSA